MSGLSIQAIADQIDLKISTLKEDREWDEFVEKDACGHFEQSSAWACAKSDTGWSPLRITVYQGKRIVAGVQILLRPLPFLGWTGYVPKGPLSIENDCYYAALVIRELKAVAKEKRIRVVMAQASAFFMESDTILDEEGFSLEKNNSVIAATTRIDLTQEPDAILSGMSRRWRYNFRLAERSGVSIQEGDEKDIGLFYRMMIETCKRQNVEPNPSDEGFFHRLWQSLAHKGNMKLFFAVYKEEKVSGMMAIPYGETFYNWKVGWNGDYPSLRANHLLVYKTILWAKNNGYRYFDFMGISRSVAEQVLSGSNFNGVAKGTDLFKLSFGGDISLFPDVRVYFSNPLLGFTYQRIYKQFRMFRHGT
jgi:peptidoglycan pentaglycine glycine transferase (the first glycine)